MIASLIIAIPLIQIASDPPNKGSINGRTLTESGQPEPGVQVTVDRADGAVHAKAIRYVETDANGIFVIDKLQWGTYRVETWKESAGYPNTAFSFYSNDINPIVSIDSDRPAAELVINLGPKAGVIGGTVVDATTGQPVNAGAHLWRASNNHWIDQSVNGSHLRLLVPADVAVGLKFQANGYGDWTYPGPNATTGNGSLVLHSGAQLNLDIRLQRASK
jgi:hypothetical protein